MFQFTRVALFAKNEKVGYICNSLICWLFIYFWWETLLYLDCSTFVMPRNALSTLPPIASLRACDKGGLMALSLTSAILSSRDLYFSKLAMFISATPYSPATRYFFNTWPKGTRLQTHLSHYLQKRENTQHNHNTWKYPYVDIGSRKYLMEYFNTPTQSEPAHYSTFFSIPDLNLPDIVKPYMQA